MRVSLTATVAVSVVFCATGQAMGDPLGRVGCEPNGITAIANEEISATLAAAGERIRITGQTSIHLAASAADFEEGVFRVGGWNLAFFSVPQGPISGAAKLDRSEGLLGFASNSRDTILRYDRESGTIEGEIRGFIDTSHLSTVILEEVSKREGADEFYQTLTQPATLSVRVKLNGEFRPDKEKYGELRALVRGEIGVPGFEHEGIAYPAYAVEFEYLLAFDYVIYLLEPARKLCVQPVRIVRIRVIHNSWGWPYFVFETTGAGLAFGRPGVKEQWEKADIVFTYREWKNVWDSGYWVTTGGNSVEETNLRAEVDDDDCIEVFFVDDFDPVHSHGCGATWGGGTAGSKIISSDINARNGIDFTHLAHELGHVVGLKHPGDTATASMTPASTGTLMCPSGCDNDNPTRNSQENKDNAANPLFQFAFKWLTAGPDCEDSSDCGSCP